MPAALEDTVALEPPSPVRRTALIAGATGLVGRACLARLLDEPRYSHVVALARRPLDIAHPKLHVEVAELSRLADAAPPACDDLFCGLGTTIAKAGSKEAFRTIDHDAIIAVAEHALRGGATRMAVVSSAGADRPGGNFYLQVKAHTEAALRALPFRALCVLRPGLLLGAREESRPAEAFFRVIAPALNTLLVGPLRKYRAIAAEQVATAMVQATLADGVGVHVLHYDEIVTFATRQHSR